MILNKIQLALEELYRIPPAPSVTLFTVPQRVEATVCKIGHRLNGEALLIKENGDSIQVGLFIAPNILKHLSKQNPLEALTEKNLSSFLVTVEGVSHFLYFIRRAEKGEPVTGLELEIQGEVDKYLLATFLYFQQHRCLPDFLFSRLFDKPSFNPALSKGRRERYTEALRLAVKFCASLEEKYLRFAKWNIALEKARAFYRLNHWDKIRRLTP